MFKGRKDIVLSCTLEVTNRKRMSIPANIGEQIHQTFLNAIATGAIKLTETVVEKTKDSHSGMQYLVSYAPSLALKPERKEIGEKRVDPFANPSPNLIVCEDLTGNEQYQLLLNKFPIIPEHSLIVTKEYRDQTEALNPQDLATAFKLIVKLNKVDENRQHLVFYNSGKASGSSQDHKHLQVFELPQNFTPFQETLCSGKEHFLPNIQQEPLQSNKVSFAHFVLPLPESSDDVDEHYLALCYFSLLQRTLSFFQDWLNERPEQTRSYNVLLTQKFICLVPRSNAKTTCNIDRASEDPKYTMGINATGYLGLLLAKTQEAYDTIREDPTVIDRMLLDCGFPNTAGIKPTEYNY